APGERPVPEPGNAAVDEYGAGSQTILTVLHTCCGDSVGHEAEAVGTEHAEVERDHLRVDVHPIGDQAADGPRVGEGGPRQSGLAVVHRSHRVEEVRD